MPDGGEGRVWRCDASRDLAIVLDDSEWDNESARSEVFAWSELPGGDLDPRLCRMAFLIYDAAAPDRRSSYSAPFCRVQRGELVVTGEGISAALARLPELIGVPPAAVGRAKLVAAGYIAQLRELDRERQEKLAKRQPMTREELFDKIADRGLDTAVHWRVPTGLGNIIMTIPTGVLAMKAFAKFAETIEALAPGPAGQPSARDMWRTAALALDAALQLDPRAQFDEDDLLDAVAERAWPRFEQMLRQRFLDGSQGAPLRRWLDEQIEARASEKVFAAREVAQRQGMRAVHQVIRELVEALSVEDPSARAAVLTMHSRAISEAMGT